MSPLLLSVKTNKAKAVKALLAAGCKVKATDSNGRSTVYWAAQEGHMDVLNVRLFLHVIVYLKSFIVLFYVFVYIYFKQMHETTQWKISI